MLSIPVDKRMERKNCSLLLKLNCFSICVYFYDGFKLSHGIQGCGLMKFSFTASLGKVLLISFIALYILKSGRGWPFSIAPNI